MKDDIRRRLEREIEDWRARFSELRVQASLGRMELRDKMEELERSFDRARSEAGRRIGELRQTGGKEVEAVAKSVEAAWEELRKTYQEIAPRRKKE